MKKLLLFLLILFLIIKIGRSQTNVYHSFPDSAYWRIDAGANWHECSPRYYYHYFTNGDTLIKGNSYKKLIRSNIYYEGDSSCYYFWPWATFTGYLGAIRDDSIANKTFYVVPNDSSEILLFDYNLVIGDTIKGYIASNNEIITSVDSVIILSKERKRWNFESGYIIQGIGSSKGLIERLYYDGIGFSELICVRDTSSVIYDSGINSIMGCQLITHFENLQQLTSEINIFPNPTDKIITIEAPQKSSIGILNINGQIIKTICSKNTSTTVDLTDLSSGVYIIRVKTDKEIVTKKFIKE